MGFSRKDIWVEDVENARDEYFNLRAAEIAASSLRDHGIKEYVIDQLEARYFKALDIENYEEQHDEMESIIVYAAWLLDFGPKEG